MWVTKLFNPLTCSKDMTSIESVNIKIFLQIFCKCHQEGLYLLQIITASKGIRFNNNFTKGPVKILRKGISQIAQHYARSGDEACCIFPPLKIVMSFPSIKAQIGACVCIQIWEGTITINYWRAMNALSLIRSWGLVHAVWINLVGAIPISWSTVSKRPT